MSTTQGTNDVTLSVEFAGICLYVIHRERKDVTVLIPTCLPDRVSTTHEDEERGARHVPYLLMDLANLDERIATPGLFADGPKFQVVRRLRREELSIGLDEPEESVVQVDPGRLALPDLSIYDNIRLKPLLLSDTPPVELDVRITLKGGEFTAETVGGSGRGEVDARRRNWDEVEADWAGSIKWTRTIKKDSLPKDFLTIGISSWDTGPGARFRLTPIRRGSGEVIELKIANLCEENPLEWWEFEPTFDKDDVDFKWLYRLFEAKDGGSLLKAIRGSDPRSKFPYPKLTRRGARTTGNTGCTGGQFTPPR